MAVFFISLCEIRLCCHAGKTPSGRLKAATSPDEGEAGCGMQIYSAGGR